MPEGLVPGAARLTRSLWQAGIRGKSGAAVTEEPGQ
jgi:hypothetical protein